MTNYTCTEVHGFSQTRNWYRPFELKLGTGRYQLLRVTNVGLKWQDPNYPGWKADIISKCTSSSNAPDRIIGNIGDRTCARGATKTAWVAFLPGAHRRRHRSHLRAPGAI